MNMLMTFFREAIINLLSAKLRAFLAILGVLVGTASVVALISSSELATTHALAQFKNLGTNLLSVYIRDADRDDQQKTSKQFLLSDVPALQKVSNEVTDVAPYTLGFAPMYFEDTNINGQIIGATESFARIAKLNLASGRFVSYLDQHNFYCVLGSGIAETIKKSGSNPLYHQLQVGKNVLTVIGILKPWPDSLFISADINHSIIVPINASYLLSSNVAINNILFRLVEHADVDGVKTQINQHLTQLLPGKMIIFNSPEQLIDIIAKSRQTYSLLLIAIGSISLIVGGIGVMNIMLVSVIERRREIGIRMAIGAQQSDILRMFLIEAVLLTLIGGFLGVVLGILSSYILTIITDWTFYFYLTPVILGFVVSVIVGIVSGFYPAWQASKLDPIQTLAS